MRKTTRKDALDAGEQYYIGDRPCKRGHRPHKRITRNGNCYECNVNAIISQRTRKSKDAPIGRENVNEEDFFIVSGKETYKEMVKRVYKRDRIW